jgi:integrase/recombinase XerD
MDIRKMHYLSSQEANNLLSSVRNPKHRLILLLMIDCGLRVSECVSLRYKNFDFKNRTLNVRSLKKRDKHTFRTIPLSTRLYDQLARYLNARIGISSEDYLFPNPRYQKTINDKNTPAPCEAPHITRFAVNRILSRLQYRHPVSGINLHPHALRHTFATQHLSAGTPLHNIKEMLGHSSLNTTLIYAHIPTENLRKDVERVTNPKSPLQKFFGWLIAPFRINRNPKLINLHFPNTGIPTIGRNPVLKQILSNAEKGINTAILGTVGIGKSHLINQIKEQFRQQDHSVHHAKGLLTLDNTAEIKPTLAQMLLYILKTDQQGVYNFLFPGFDYSRALQHISRDTVQNIANRIVEITPKKYYTLLIDNVDAVTPKAAKVLEIFKDHFTIITSAREVSVKRSSFLWNFDIIRLKELDRDSSMKLIQALSTGIQVQDYNLFRNHIYEQTNGNPRAIYEIIDRYKKEPVISNQVVRQVRHTGALSEIDCSFAILLFLACVACLRYLNHEVENASFRVIGGIGLVLLFLSRYVFRFTRKVHV